MKRITKVLCGILGAGLLLTGCATVSNIKNNYNEVIYTGTAAAMVDNYLYYANAIADVTDTTKFADDDGYKAQAKISYLARLNTAVLDATSKDNSPKKTEAVTKEVVGQSTAFKFVLGNYVYYTTPKTEMVKNDSGKLEQDYKSSKLYRSKLNGDDKKCLYTTSSAISKIEVLKYGGKYYVVMLEGQNLVKIDLKNTKVSKIAENVTSVAIPRTYERNKEQSSLTWNGKIYYTYTKDSSTKVCKVAIDGAEGTDIWTGSLTFVGRERDQLFYTIGSTTYKFDANQAQASPMDSNSYHFYDAAISDVYLIAENNVEYGYIFTANSMTTYVENNASTGSITFTADDQTLSAKIVAVDGRRVFVSTETGIYKTEISTAFDGHDNSISADCTQLAEMTAISQTLYAYDGQYVYFYAQLQDVEDDEKITDTDSNYYLYRTKVEQMQTTPAYELLSLTQTAKRH